MTYHKSFRSIGFLVAALAVATVGVMQPSEAHADPTYGEKTLTGTLTGGYETKSSFVLNADETTIFDVNGDGKGDLDCELYDSNGTLLYSDRTESDECSVSVKPNVRERFTIKILNRGAKSDSYTLHVY